MPSDARRLLCFARGTLGLALQDARTMLQGVGPLFPERTMQLAKVLDQVLEIAELSQSLGQFLLLSFERGGETRLLLGGRLLVDARGTERAEHDTRFRGNGGGFKALLRHHDRASQLQLVLGRKSGQLGAIEVGHKDAAEARGITSQQRQGLVGIGRYCAR